MMINPAMYKLSFAVIVFFVVEAVSAQPIVRDISIDLRQQEKPLRPVWAYFGYDEPNYTYMKDGKKLLSELAALSPVTVSRRSSDLKSVV